MKRKNVSVLIITLIFLGCVMFLFRNHSEESKEILKDPVNNEELLTSSKEGYNFVKIYKQKNRLVVKAESEAAFFEGIRFVVETKGEIKPEDIDITWMTIGGSTKRSEDNDRIIAEIKISDKDELICDTKINFMKKAFEAVEDVLERTVK